MISEYILFHAMPNKISGRFKKKNVNLKQTCTNPVTGLSNCEYQEKHNNSTNPIVLPVKLTLKAPIPQNGQPHSPRIYEKG